MRLLRLDLIAYGAFADKSLDLDADGARTVVVYGNNEAGKSTTKRAIRGFLFGIDDRSHDDHRFAKADLRIGARVALPNGDVLEAIRRRAQKNTLVSRDEKPLGDGLLEPWLHGLTASAYTTIFGLDHEVLREGGQALLEGEGDLGESLLSASLGITHLHRTLKDLRARADAVFSIRGTTKPLGTALAAFTKAKKSSRDDALKTEAYDVQLRGIAEAKAEREALASEQKAKAIERAMLVRLARALPLAAREASLERELAEGHALANDLDLVGLGKEIVLAERAKADLAKNDERLAALGTRPVADGDAPHVELPDDAEDILRDGPRLVDAKRRAELAAAEARAVLADAVKKRDGALLVPSPEHAPLHSTLEAFEDRERVLAEARRAIDAAAASLANETERHRSKARALSDGGILPSDADLAKVRGERDQLLEAAERNRESASFAAIARAVTRADQIADALRREADRVAGALRLADEAAELSARTAATDAQRLACSDNEARELAEWSSAWERAGIVPRSPREMREWLALAGRVVEAEGAVTKRELEAAHARDAENAWRPRFARLSAALGLANDVPVEGVARAVSKIRSEETVRAERASILARSATTRGELDAFAVRTKALLSRHDVADAGAPWPIAEAKLLAERHERATATFREIAEVRARLRELWPEGTNPRDSANGCTATEIDALADGLEARLDEIATSMERLDRAIGGSEQGVADLQNRSLAAKAAEDAASELARIVSLSHTYVRTQASIFLLERAMQELREASAGPLVTRASDLFARITGGSFASIATVLDERTGLPQLRARRDGGPTVLPAQMSDGARDALYLALRIASLEEAASRGLTLPVVLDDVLVHFDDDRARTALTAIGELGLRQQVIFFTHHERLVAIAQEALGNDVAVRRLSD